MGARTTGSFVPFCSWPNPKRPGQGLAHTRYSVTRANIRALTPGRFRPERKQNAPRGERPAVYGGEVHRRLAGSVGQKRHSPGTAPQPWSLACWLPAQTCPRKWWQTALCKFIKGSQPWPLSLREAAQAHKPHLGQLYGAWREHAGDATWNGVRVPESQADAGGNALTPEPAPLSLCWMAIESLGFTTWGLLSL